jgi:hypothetical protein
MEQTKPTEGVFELLHLRLNSLHVLSSAILPRALTPDSEFVIQSCLSNKQRRREKLTDVATVALEWSIHRVRPHVSSSASYA